MGLTILPLGGYQEVGKNCTAVIIDDEIVLLDMGLHLEGFISVQEEIDEFTVPSTEQLLTAKAIPDLSFVDLSKVCAIIASHAHLDHIGAIPFLADRIKAPIHATAFTGNIIRRLCEDKKIDLHNKLTIHDSNSTFKVGKHIEAEFIHITHSIPQTVVIVLHTPYGKIVFAIDYKLDNTPVLGSITNEKRLRELKNADVLFLDSLYAGIDAENSEMYARTMLEENFQTYNRKGKALVVTTFASHTARLKSIMELGRKIGREVIFIGRSMAKYCDAAKDENIFDFSNVEFIRFGSKVRRFFKKINKQNRDKYLFVVTGHQGEHNAMLSKMIDLKWFQFEKDDVVVFSSFVIPTDTCVMSRAILEEKLHQHEVTVIKDIHVSGHAYYKDHIKMLEMIKPKMVVPIHAELDKMEKMKDTCASYGEVHILENGKTWTYK